MAGLVCFWDFQEEAGRARVGKGRFAYALEERGGVVPVEGEGFFGERSAVMGNGAWLEIAREKCGGLCIGGRGAQVSVVAWVKRRRQVGREWACQAVAGVWNEHGKRQYCWFLNLPIHESAEQVGAHVSGVGGPTGGLGIAWRRR